MWPSACILKDVVSLTINSKFEREIIMALLGALSGLIVFACVLAALRSKRNNQTEKVKTLTLR
jgi:hypothetical protein